MQKVAKPDEFWLCHFDFNLNIYSIIIVRMDIGYILFNTIVYGIMALLLASFFSFGKLLNLSIWWFMVMLGYVLYDFINHWLNSTSILVTIALVGLFFLINRGLLKYFSNDKQRDHVGIILTLWVNIILENATSYIYWPLPVSLNIIDFKRYILLAIFILLISLSYYFFKHTLYGVILKGISENNKIIKSLGIQSTRLLQYFFGCWLILLMRNAFMILNKTNLKWTDGLFYIIKWIWIMILVGIGKKEYMFIGALIYVVAEYLLFIQRWLPISYKETLILIVIVILLLFKPEWLFTFKRRKI